MTVYKRVLMDTSAIVAIMQPNEQHHEACVEALKEMQTPFLTTWPVLTEADFLLRKDPAARLKLTHFVASIAVDIVDLDRPFLAWYERFQRQYKDQEVQLADASLVWLAETRSTDTVFTLDRRDFSVFRIESEQGFSSKGFIIIPESS